MPNLRSLRVVGIECSSSPGINVGAVGWVWTDRYDPAAGLGLPEFLGGEKLREKIPVYTS